MRYVSRPKEWLLRFLKGLVDRLPWWGGQPLDRYFLDRKFSVEVALIHGVHRNPNRHRSIIHFSMNKAATQYVKSILARCAAEEGIATVDLHGYAFHTDFPYLDHLSAEEMEGYQHIFKPKGYLYSVFGGMIEGLPDLEDYLTVLMVRDPRDVLVSKYYSIAYSHSEPDKSGNKYEEFMSQRAYAREVSIDEYVLSERDTVYSVYQRYRDLLVERFSHYYCTRYEEMIADFSDWLGALLNYCQFDVSDELFDSLVEEHEGKVPKKEDINKHLRKGIAGDYKNKLESRTIEILNAQFEEVLKGFGYAF